MSNNKKPNQMPVMIPTRKGCNHPVTPQTSLFLPSKTKPNIMQEYCLLCLLQRAIDEYKIQPCGELDLTQEKFLWRD